MLHCLFVPEFLTSNSSWSKHPRRCQWDYFFQTMRGCMAQLHLWNSLWWSQHFQDEAFEWEQHHPAQQLSSLVSDWQDQQGQCSLGTHIFSVCIAPNVTKKGVLAMLCGYFHWSFLASMNNGWSATMTGVCAGLMLLIAWRKTFIPCQTIAGLLGYSLNTARMYDLLNVREIVGGSVMLAWCYPWDPFICF